MRAHVCRRLRTQSLALHSGLGLLLGWGQTRLRVKSSDTVTIHTLTTGSPTSLARAGVKDSDIQPELKDIYAHVKRELGGHILTGPV